MRIVDVFAKEIFDSRGIPTVECTIALDDGMKVVSSVPSGISKGMHEAVELRDGGDRLMGLGVRNAVDTIEQDIAPLIIGKIPDLVQADTDMVDLDGTDNKSELGANSILAVSMAVCRAQAYYESIPVYELIAGLCNLDTVALPRPMFNFLGGGLHVNNGNTIQEFMVVPTRQVSFHEALEVGVTVFHSLKTILEAKGMSTLCGPEGGFAPILTNGFQACDILMEAIEKSGNSENVMIALDVAASHFYSIETGLYLWEGKYVNADYLIEWYKNLVATYPVYSIEDGLSEVDWVNWKTMKKEIGQQVRLVGDDLFVTNPQRVWDGIENDVATSVLIKPNQIGTITETLQVVDLCNENEWDVIVSHRSGETNDSFIADLAVGVNASHIKAGGCSRGERMAKYNRLMQIEDELLADQTEF
jgi:enolase